MMMRSLLVAALCSLSILATSDCYAGSTSEQQGSIGNRSTRTLIQQLATLRQGDSPAASPKGSQTAAKPNVLLLLTDDAGMDQLQIYGYGGRTAPPTPNLATLQKAGLTFTDAWTMPACSTSRGVLYTGRYPFRTQLEAALGPSDLANSMISPWEKTLPKVMAKAGYATALFGKFHVGLQGNNPFGLDMANALGWDYFNGWLDTTGDPSSIDTTAGGVAPAGTYPNGYVPGSNVANGADTGACYYPGSACRAMSSPTNSKNPAGRACRDDGGIFVPNAACTTPMPSNLNFQTLSAHYVSPLVISEGGRSYAVPPTDKAARTFRNVQQTNAAISWINRQQKKGKPWFATISTATVHTPMQVPPINTLPANAVDPNGFTTSTTEGKIIVANQMLQAMDYEFGRLLESTGLAKKVNGKLVPTLDAANTVVIYVNDNGSLGSQVRAPFNPYRSKGTPYQTGVWTPMVVAGPIVKTRPNQTVSAMVNIADLYELIGKIAGENVREGNPRTIDSVPMMPYFRDVNYPSIRDFNFTLVGPNLQADGGANGPCQFPGANGDTPSCSQIPVTKSVCEDNGGVWFGEGADASYQTGSTYTPIPSSGFEYCCQAQQWIKNNGGVPGTVIPVTGIAVRDRSGFKLVRNEMNDYDASTNECIYGASYDELYIVDQDTPRPRLDNSNLLIPTPYSPLAQQKYNKLSTYMNDMLASDPGCLAQGDGNDDGVVDQQDLRNYNKMIQLTSNSSWYDVNLDGYTNDDDQQIIVDNLGYTCR